MAVQNPSPDLEPTKLNDSGDYLVSPTILLNNGYFFGFEDPWLANYDIVTIAKSISKLCRFTGHTKQFYSVAQHSVIVSQLAEEMGALIGEEYALAGLLHDSAEMVMQDLSSPLKGIIKGDYRAHYKVVEIDLLGRWGIRELPKAVKVCDIIAMTTEIRDLMPREHVGQGKHWHVTRYVTPRTRKIIPLPAFLAEWQFLTRYDQIAPNYAAKRNLFGLGNGKVLLSQHWFKDLIGRLLLRIC